MPFDPTADPTGAADSLFPGTLTDPQLAAIYGLDTHTAALPVLLKKGAAPAPGAPVGPLKTGYVTDGTTDQTIRYDQALAQLGTMTQPEVQQLQQRLYAGGFYSKSYYTKKGAGVDLGNANDPGTVSAFRAALNDTVRSQGMSLDDIVNAGISRQSQNAQAKGAAAPALGSGAPPVSITLTNPADLATAAHSATSKLYGRQASHTELAGFTNAFHSQEMQAQTAAQNPNATTTVQAPNPTDFADQYFQQANPGAVQTNTIGGYIQKILDLSSGKAAVA